MRNYYSRVRNVSFFQLRLTDFFRLAMAYSFFGGLTYVHRLATA